MHAPTRSNPRAQWISRRNHEDGSECANGRTAPTLCRHFPGFTLTTMCMREPVGMDWPAAVTVIAVSFSSDILDVGVK